MQEADIRATPFLDYSAAETRAKVERLYRKTLAPVEPPPANRKVAELDPRVKDKQDKERYAQQRERVNKRIAELEKTRPVKSELAVQEDRLAGVRSEHDRLTFELARDRKKLSLLSSAQTRLEAQNSEQAPTSAVEAVRGDLADIDGLRVNHELAADQLQHMFLAYKADILTQQELMQRLKDELRKGRTLKERLHKEFAHLSKECDKYWGKIAELGGGGAGAGGKERENWADDPRLNGEVLALQGRTAWQLIEAEERNMEEEEQARLAKIKARHERIAQDKFDDEFNLRMIRREKESKKYNRLVESIKKLQEVLRIGREDEIIDTYRELLGNREKIKDITASYKLKVDEVEAEIAMLQEEYKRQKYEVHGLESRYDDPSHVARIVEVIKAHEKELAGQDAEAFSAELVGLRKKLIGYLKKEKNQEEIEEPIPTEDSDAFKKLKNKSDIDALALVEKQFSDSFKAVFKKELEMKRMTEIVNSACTTVSRIMYQLDRNVIKFYPERKEL